MLVHEEVWLMKPCLLRKSIGDCICCIKGKERSIHSWSFLLYDRMCWQVDVSWRHGWQVHTTLGMKCLCVYAVFFPVLSWPPNPWVQRNWSCWMSDPVIIPLITHCALPSRCRGPGAEKLGPGTTANTEHAPRQINKSGHIYHLFTSILCWTGIIYCRRCCGSGVTSFCT